MDTCQEMTADSRFVMDRLARSPPLKDGHWSKIKQFTVGVLQAFRKSLTHVIAATFSKAPQIFTEGNDEM